MLTVKQTMTLHFEAAHAVATSAAANATKEVRIRELFDESATTPTSGCAACSTTALEYAPMLVRRLRRMQEKRQAACSSRRLITR